MRVLIVLKEEDEEIVRQMNKNVINSNKSIKCAFNSPVAPINF